MHSPINLPVNLNQRLALALSLALVSLSAPGALARVNERILVSCRSAQAEVSFDASANQIDLKIAKSAFPSRASETGSYEERCLVFSWFIEARGFQTANCSPAKAFIAFEPDFQSALERIDDDQTGERAREILREAARSGTRFSARLNAFDSSIADMPGDANSHQADLVCNAETI